MAMTYNYQKKKWISNLFVFSFLLLVIGTAFLSNVLKTPIKNHNDLIEQSLVFNNNELDNITGLSLKNKSGEYLFERSDVTSMSSWHMTSPRDISAKSVFIEKLFTSLNIIKTKKLLADDAITNSNFSLDKPTAILTLTDNAGKSIIMSVGIMNTIDNSTYMKISGRSGIYHVEAPSITLENTILADLVESSVFDFYFQKILSFKIFKKGTKNPLFDAHKGNGQWLSFDEKALDAKKVEETVDEFILLKSSFILDNLSDAQKKQTQGLLATPEYTVKVEKDNNETLSYQVSAITKNISEVALNGEPHFLITESHSPVVYIIKGEFLRYFEKNNESFNASGNAKTENNPVTPKIPRAVLPTPAVNNAPKVNESFE
ncbi:MAG: DUF4340 domain-containing protein [Bdellovibrionales bacterium]|nr:DUF4340 domain-containing protein [Bdellovibrionales bacterium]